MSISAVGIALSGMNAATRRLEVSASNVANARTTGTVPDAEGRSTAYQPLALRQEAVPGGGVTTTVVRSGRPPGLGYDPSSPDADARGLVGTPDVDLAGEVATQLSARLEYQASLKVLKVADDMLKSTLDTLA